MRAKKSILGIILSVIIIFSGIMPLEGRAEEAVVNPETEGQEKVLLEPKEELPRIELSVGEGQKAPTYAANEKVPELKIRIENQGNLEAKNVQITTVIDDVNKWPFVTAQMNYNQNFDVIAPGATDAFIKYEDLTVRDDVVTQSHKLVFSIKYDGGEAIKKEVYINTKAKPEETVKPVPTPEQPPTPEGGSGIDVGGGDYGSGGISNNEPVVTGGNKSTSVPRVIVAGFRTEPGAVNAGSNFKLIIQVKNTSTKTAVSNMLFDLQAPSSGTEANTEAPAFLPASGSSSIFLDNIPAGGMKEIAIDLNARADLVQKPYSTVLSMKYEDGNGTQYDSISGLAIPVKQAARFEFSDVEIAPESIAVGEEVNITCSLYNTGRIKLYNVKVKFEGEGIKGKDVFIGNLESGATGTIDGMITGEKESAGGAKCKMIVSYEDEAGGKSSIEKEFTLEVLPAAAMGADVGMMAAEPIKKGLPVVPIAIGAAAVVAAIIAVIVIVRKKKKKSATEEEDLVDEVDRFTEDE